VFHRQRKYELLGEDARRRLDRAVVRRRPLAVARGSAAPQKILSVFLRVAFVVLLGLGSRSRTDSPRRCAPSLVDVSDSISDGPLADARALVDRAWAEKPRDGIVKLITFARRPRLAAPSEKEPEKAPDRSSRRREGRARRARRGTNLQAAVQLAYGLYEAEYLKRAVLVSDGVQTDGDFLAEANRAKDFGIRLFTMAYRRPAPPRSPCAICLPDHVKVGETFEVHADIYASRATTAKAKLYQSEALNGLEGVKRSHAQGRHQRRGLPQRRPREGRRRTSSISSRSRRIASPRTTASHDDRRPRAPRGALRRGHAQRAAAPSALTAQQFDVDMRRPRASPAR
jgi:hypothetical protein